MDAEKLEKLLRKYLQGQCSDAEKALVEAFYASFDGDPDHLPAAGELQQDYRRLLGRVRAQVTNPSESRGRIVSWWMKAAAVLIVAAAGLWIWKAAHRSPTPQLAEKSASPVRQFLRLPDGSSVLVKAGSKLQYPQHFGSNSREVYLTGEAFFDIASDAARPFIVHAGKVKTTVLGTAFTIQAYAGEPEVTVTVTRGKVQVGDESKNYGIIGSNERISVNTERRQAAQTRVEDLKKAALWVHEDLVFSNTSFTEAAAMLEAKYGVTIRFDNELLKDCRFTTSFLQQESLDGVLVVLCEFTRSGYTIKDNLITISGEGCP